MYNRVVVVIAAAKTINAHKKALWSSAAVIAMIGMKAQRRLRRRLKEPQQAYKIPLSLFFRPKISSFISFHEEEVNQLIRSFSFDFIIKIENIKIKAERVENSKIHFSESAMFSTEKKQTVEISALLYAHQWGSSFSISGMVEPKRRE